jgi:hypothetical protein
MIHPDRFKIGQLVSGTIHDQPFAGTVISRGVDARHGYADGPAAELTSVTIETSHLVATLHGRQVREVTMRGEAEIGRLTAHPASDTVRYSATVHFADGNTRYNGIGDAAETVAWLGRYGVTWHPGGEPVFAGRIRNGVESVDVGQFEV